MANRNLSFLDKEDRPWPNPRLTSASIVGHTTETSTRLWVRVKEPGAYELVISRERLAEWGAEMRVEEERMPALESVSADAGLSHTFTEDTDLTHTFDVTGLQPGTTYHYAVRSAAGMWEMGWEQVLTFRTRPASMNVLTFGVHSCHMPYDKRNLVNMDLWDEYYRELEERNADFVIGGGDQVYVDGNKHISIWEWLKKVKNEGPTLDDMASWYRDIYRGYWGPLPVRRLFRRFPTYMIWDDHEIMDGWGSYTKKELEDQLNRWWEFQGGANNLKLAKMMFEAATKVYIEYQHSHNPPTPKGQFDYPFEWGPASFYVLDMRGHRDYNREKNRILGEAQLKRILAWIKAEAPKSDRVLFIVSPVPIIHARSFVVNKADLNFLGLADDLRDEWEHESNWIERDVVLDAVFTASEQHGRKIVFLSGDVHLGAAFRLMDVKHPKASVHQLTSSAISYADISALKRKALRMAVADEGALESADPKNPEKRTDSPRFRFKRLSVYDRNNFGLVRIERKGTELAVGYDLYGAPESDHEGIIRLTRVSF